jgi:GGDEF domain-containing protein
LPALVLAVWAARGVTRPLRNLTLAVSRIAAGDYAQSVTRGGDELARLALAVDAMQGEIRSREARIEEQGRQDGPTGLANRHPALGRLSALPTPPEGMCWRLVLLDIRRLSEVNDALGPAVGDRILVEVAKRLRGLRPQALLACFGANEFMLLESALLADPAEPGRLGLLSALQEAYALDAAPVRVGLCAAPNSLWRTPSARVCPPAPIDRVAKRATSASCD